MNLHDAFSSPSMSDIIYSCDGHVPESRVIQHETARTRHAKLRASQGAAQSGHLNVPDGVGYVPREEILDVMAPKSQKTLDTNRENVVRSLIAPITAPTSAGSPALHGALNMELTLKGLTKNGKTALFAGAATIIGISLSNFANKTAPATLLIDDGILAKAVKTSKVKLTKEQRAALPKPTLAERAAKAEARAAKLRAQANAL